MDYASFIASLKRVALIDSVQGNANLLQVLPDIINYAELRIYREFNFLATQTSDHSMLTTSGVRRVEIPSTQVVVEGLSLILPAGAVPTDVGAQRIPLLRVSRGFCDTTWPVETNTDTPRPFETYYAIYSDQEEEGEGLPAIPNSAIIAPTPDGSYHAEFTGTFRPDPLSASNTTTVLTEFYPDLFFAAAMIWTAGWEGDYGSQSDDPRLAVSWEQVYKELANGVSIEGARQRGGLFPYGQSSPLMRGDASVAKSQAGDG